MAAERSKSARISEIFTRAEALRSQGRLAQAAAAHQSILELDPNHLGALNALAAAALQNGELGRAVQLYDTVIARNGGPAEAYYKRGNALNRLGRWEAALADYDHAIALDSGYGNAFCNRGTVLGHLGHWSDSLASYDRALALNPADYLAYYNRGRALAELRRFDDAIASYDRAIALNSGYVEAYVNRGNVEQRLGRHAAAVESYDKAIMLKPVFAEAFLGRGTSLQNQGRFEEAISSYDQTLALNPDEKYVVGMRRYAKAMICDWSGLEAELGRLAAELKVRHPLSSPFPVLAFFDSPPLHRLAAEIWVREECPANDALGAIAARVRGDRIRVGYFSADFRDHAVSLLTAELFETHDRSRFEVTAFAFGPRADYAVSARLERAFDRFVDVRDRSDREVALLAREFGIDIAVDLGGFTESARPQIFALRAAPIQINYLGYPGTMGAQYMDYLIGDRTVIPQDQQHHYTEKIIYLPGSYLPNDSTRSIADTKFTREDLGLPPAGFVFCCFNNSYKIGPDVFDRWIRMLRRTENSVLWLSANNPAAVRNLRREASLRGIDAERLIFAGRVASQPEHLARLRAADLFLDTLPYNAHATAVDALWAGLPVLTCPGHAFAGRVAASLLRAIDLPELIAATPTEYEALGAHLAANPAQLARIRQKLAHNRAVAPLFDTVQFAKNLEFAYIEVYERHVAQLPPEHVYPLS